MQSPHFLTKADTARRYNKTPRTIDNWLADPRLDFPKPVVFRGRPHISVDLLDAWDARQAEIGAIEKSAA